MAAIFHIRLRSIRQELGFSQTQLAEESGLPTSSISHFETGKRLPSFDSLISLADALQVSLDYLVGRGTTTQELINGRAANNATRQIKILIQGYNSEVGK